MKWGKQAIRPADARTRAGWEGLAGNLPPLKRNPPVHRAPLLLVHLHPARDLVKRAVATAAHIIAQRSRAMPGAGRIGSNLKVGSRIVRRHDAAIIPIKNIRSH